MRVAVIGTGISGMAAAWLLRNHHDVTVFEKNPRIGGHTNTQTVVDPRGMLEIDTGFIVHNDRNYPRLLALFDLLGVATQPSNMSFSASIDNGRVEYAGDALFAQRANVVSPSHWRMLLDIVRFNRLGKQALSAGSAINMSLGQWLDQHHLGKAFCERYLLPMAASIWSSPTQSIRAFSASALLEFFNNHGLLDLSNRPQWRTVVGGSRAYLERMASDLQGRIQANSPITQVLRATDGVRVHGVNGELGQFDAAVFATHADQTLAMLADADEAEHSLLSPFEYRDNHAVLHSDVRLMPKRKKAWSSWNYLAEHARLNEGDAPSISISYWMNLLQSLDAERDYFVTLNPLTAPSEALVHYETTYEHPVFNQGTRRAQASLGQLQGHRSCYYCGAWMGYGFHEDGLGAAIEMVKSMGQALPPSLENARIEGPPYMHNQTPWTGPGAELING